MSELQQVYLCCRFPTLSRWFAESFTSAAFSFLACRLQFVLLSSAGLWALGMQAPVLRIPSFDSEAVAFARQRSRTPFRAISDRSVQQDFKGRTAADEAKQKYLHRFMVAREEVRVRRELGYAPKDWYAHNEFPLMSRVYLTNVHRMDDKTSRQIHSFVRKEEWLVLSTEEARFEWEKRIVFHFGMSRFFGTVAFSQEIKLLDNIVSWSAVESAIVDAAMRVWARREHCFTVAYRPAKIHHNAETALREEGVALNRAMYMKACQALKPLWSDCGRIVKATRSCSRKAVFLALRKVHGYGGCGFLAKELLEDLLQTPLFQTWDPETKTWQSECTEAEFFCGVGPGARRGLNRMYGRPTQYKVWDNKSADFFLADLIALFGPALDGWPREILGSPVQGLGLSDLQFMLCEFDKHERARFREGAVRPYTPPP